MNDMPQDHEFDANPEWTVEDFARARPASEVHSPEIAALLVRKRGRPLGSKNARRKEQIALRVDAEVIESYKTETDGRGWQTQMNDAIWPRVEVAFSTGLKGWTVTVTRPTRGGRLHEVLRKFSRLEDAKAFADGVADTIAGSDGLRPRVVIYGNKAA